MLRPRSLLALTSLLLASPLLAQSSGGRTPIAPGTGATRGQLPPGKLLPKPGGGSFFVDPSRAGRAHALGLVEVRQGRVVDVHGLDANGAIDPAPFFRDFVVGETVQSDGSGYQLVSSPATQVTRLVVLRQPGAPEPFPGAGTFEELARAAEDATALVPPKDVTAALVATLPRNSALSLQFDDLLSDGASAVASLLDDVRVFVGPDGAPLTTPFAARVLFDGNHGGIAQGAFHSTRVLVDFTVSRFEADEYPLPLLLNALGLPPGAPSAASCVLRLPTKTDPGSGQFTLLRNLAGNPLGVGGNAPVDRQSPTLDVVRAARAAGDDEPNFGFLLDLELPRVLGRLPIQVTQALADPNGAPGFSFLVDWTFQGPCAGRPLVLDALQLGTNTLEVIENGPLPSGAGVVQNVRVRLAQHTPVAAGALLGNGVLVTPLRPGTETSACWFTIVPQPAQPPAAGVSTTAEFIASFSEPMRTTSVDPYDTFRLVQGPLSTPAGATNTVVAGMTDSESTHFVLVPVLPLAHAQGQATVYHLEILSGSGGPTDLAGNPLHTAPAAELRIAPSDATVTSGGLVLRFSSADEMPGVGPDLRGEFLYDLSAGEIRGRPPTFFGAPADRTNPVPSIMIPYPAGVSTPLNPLGAKLQTLWRYCDFGWNVRDETKYDVDVVGLSWAPVSGQVINDFFPNFEIRLAHSGRLPDEDLDANLLPKYPNSGLPGAGSLFDDNILDDPLSPQKIVHPRSLGYTVRAADLFSSSTGTLMMPYPLNRGTGSLVTYTWRDTSVLAKAGPSGAGIPLDIEAGPPLFLEPQAGTVAPAGAVPSIGLPLLVEFRCYPSDFGLGLNALDASLAINSSALPAFRAYSSGGINTAGNPVPVLPDQEVSPRGGYNPFSNPPGQRTLPADDVFYIGQLDLVYRVSRVHSAWFDTGAGAPTDFVALFASLAPGSIDGVSVDVRGATAFSGTGGSENDAGRIDAYGDLRQGTASFLNGIASWSHDLDAIDGARFVQLRLTFTNDLAQEAGPRLDTLALAYRH